MTPEETLKSTTEYLKNLQAMKTHYVAVGLPVGKVGEKMYEGGVSLIEVGAAHEFGTEDNPERSFLRAPFTLKKSEINQAIEKGVAAVGSGKMDADKALNLIGVVARNISVKSFDTAGYGTWPDIKAATKKAKGSSGILKDKGQLRGAITWEVRK
ncbi:phage virion morphogenesis protein [Yersinia aldovae]|uniref:hypothetical protein n=1 Tax=Yersinia aldovae TaxID=29483 RepID=UPI0011A58889|nr:hypothetical protein [Yersinia aldovae]